MFSWCLIGFFLDSYVPNTCVGMSRPLEIARRCKCECEFSIWPQILLTGVEVQSLRGARPRDRAAQISPLFIFAESFWLTRPGKHQQCSGKGNKVESFVEGDMNQSYLITACSKRTNRAVTSP